MRSNGMVVDFSADRLFAMDRQAADGVHATRQPHEIDESNKAPPRIRSDQLVNVFFQEWAPLFPVLHRPTFLAYYEQLVNGDDQTLRKNDYAIAQLYLVFGIASSSRSVSCGNSAEVRGFESQWQAALDRVSKECRIETVQCLTLAFIHNVCTGDYGKMIHYKSLAIGMAQRLGLHQSQKKFSLGALTLEMRKKLFWCLYTLDCFTAAMLGLPKLLRESEIYTEYPSDVDDEYITEKGFAPTLPGDQTRISSALALFEAARILSKVLDQVYPTATAHEISLRKLGALEEELKTWENGLAPHLKLVFVQDKPSTNVTGSRSPLLVSVSPV
jgi:Fungal specific transcription factor domain